MKHLSNDQEDSPIQYENSKSYVMKQGILLWIWWKVNGNWDINMIRISQLEVKPLYNKY